MPKPKHLSKTVIDALKPAAARYEQPDLGERRLYLVVQPSGHKSWAFRYQVDGRAKKLMIAGYPAVSVDAARKATREAKDLLARGIDPAEQKKEKIADKRIARETDVDTFAGVARLFIAKHAQPNNRGWREQARLLGLIPDPAKPDSKEAPRTFITEPGRPAYVLSRKPLTSLTKKDIQAVVDGIVNRGAPIASNRTLATMHKMFEWARKRADIDLTVNLAADIDRQPISSRERVLTAYEVTLVWRAAEKVGYPFGPVVKLLLLTAQRLREVSGLVKSEISTSGDVWSLPAARAKNKIPSAIYLSPQARVILESLPAVESKKGFLFTTTGATPVSGFSNAKDAIDAAMLRMIADDIAKAGGDPAEAKLDHWTFHDLRRTASTMMTDEVGVEPHILEAVLNHVGHKAGVAGTYNRAKYATQKAAAWNAWANHLDWIVTGKEPESNVVVLQGRA